LPERYNNRELKYELVSHSEFNACIIASKFGISLDGATLFTQSCPCSNCCKSLIQSGIRQVKTLKNCEEIWHNYSSKWKESAEITKLMLNESGVEWIVCDIVCGDKILVGGKEYSI
jgi:deoxycytidylate deaminase